VPPPAYAVDCRSLAVGSTAYGQMAFSATSCNPRLDGASVQLVEELSTPSQQPMGLLSAGLQSMARGDVCIGALHAFGARCTHLPLASGVLNASTTSLRRGAAQSIYRQSEPQRLRQMGGLVLDFAATATKTKGIGSITKVCDKPTFIKRRRKYIRRDGGWA